MKTTIVCLVLLLLSIIKAAPFLDSRGADVADCKHPRPVDNVTPIRGKPDRITDGDYSISL